MVRTCLLLLLSVTPIASVLVAQDTAAASVLAADDQRFAAMMRADTAALRTRLADDLAYTHTTGARQNKAEFLRTLASGQLRYRSIAPRTHGSFSWRRRRSSRGPLEHAG